MADELRVRLGQEQRTLQAADAPVVIGSGPAATLRSRNPSVASRHAVLDVDGPTWVVRAEGGAMLYLAGQPVPEARVGGGVQLMLGDPELGEELAVAVGGSRLPASQLATRGPTRPDPPASTGRTPTAPRRDPVGAAGSAATVMGDVGGVGLRVHHGDQEREFRPGQVVKIGRNPSNDVVLNNPLVSGFHAEARYGASGWELHDAGSKRGVFHDGQRVPRLALTGVTTTWFAEEGSGERVLFVAPGATRAPAKAPEARNRALLAAGLGVVAVLAAVALVVAFLASGDDDDGELVAAGTGTSEPDPEFDIPTLAKGTVKLVATREGSDRASVGSGTIISDGGLILTNAHVVAPSTLSNAQDPDEILIFVNERGDDRAVEPTFYGEVVASDGERDLAVVKVSTTLGGNEVGPEELSDLTVIPIGKNPPIGTELEILGYPGVAKSRSFTLTSGVVSSYTDGAAGERQLINTDAKIEHGNSGGLAADKAGTIVGVPTRYDCATAVGSDGEVVEDCESGRQNQLTAIEMAQPLIDAAEAGRDYRVEY